MASLLALYKRPEGGDEALPESLHRLVAALGSLVEGQQTRHLVLLSLPLPATTC